MWGTGVTGRVFVSLLATVSFLCCYAEDFIWGCHHLPVIKTTLMTKELLLTWFSAFLNFCFSEPLMLCYYIKVDWKELNGNHFIFNIAGIPKDCVICSYSIFPHWALNPGRQCFRQYSWLICLCFFSSSIFVMLVDKTHNRETTQ